LCALLLLLSAALLLPTSAAAAKKKKRVYWYRYTVQFTCGTNATDLERIVPGEYVTSVHVLNPEAVDAVVQGRLAMTYPPGPGSTGFTSDPGQQILPGLSATEVDCGLLAMAPLLVPGLPPLPPYVQGFGVIESNRPLDVTVVHTVAGPGGDVSQQIEKVPPRLIARRPLLP